MLKRYLTLRWLIPCAVMLCMSATTARAQIPAGFDSARHMSVREVRPGMTGYGLSVFSGTRIEPFDVEVVSVESASRPGKAVVWIRCPGDRMQKLGPVQGMSGSPIYLWTERDRNRRRDGSSGRIIGAFAYGFGLSKDAYAGVQPIEQMLQASARAKTPTPSKQRAANGKLMSTAVRAIRNMPLSADRRWRMDIAAKLAGTSDTRPEPSTTNTTNRMPLAIPLRVGSARDATLLTPFLKEMGIQPVAAGRPATTAPSWLKGKQIPYEPGGVLSVPLVTGDVDFPAVGTITDVLRDSEGRITNVLGFGHAFMGEGASHMPMGTGYVHYVQPNLSTSFKLGGTLQIRGSIINDESTAVIGNPTVKPSFRPSVVHVTWPDDTKSRTFRYNIADHYYYLPIFTAYSAIMSISSDTNIPLHSTMEMRSTLKFSGDRTVNLRAIIPEANPMGLFAEMMPFLSLLTDNPLEPLDLLSAETHITIKPGVQAATITNITLDRAIVRPGEKIIANIELTPYRGDPFIHQCALQVPDDLPDGMYPLHIGGAREYTRRLMETRPHLTRFTNVDELLEALLTLTSAPDDAVYSTLVLNQRKGVAIGRSELPKLPGSRQALLAARTNSNARPYTETIAKQDRMPYVISGQMSASISVKRYPELDK